MTVKPNTLSAGNFTWNASPMVGSQAALTVSLRAVPFLKLIINCAVLCCDLKLLYEATYVRQEKKYRSIFHLMML